MQTTDSVARNRHERRSLEAGHRLAYSIDSFAEASDIGRTSVYEAIRDGRLKAVKCGTRTLIPASAADDFFANLPEAKAA